MNSHKITKYAVTGAATALCVGLAAPVVAHASDSGQPTPAAVVHSVPSQLTLQQEQAFVDQLVTQRLAQLDAAAAKVAANPSLTSAQKSAYTAELTQIRERLLSIKAEVDAATSPNQIGEIVRAGLSQVRDPAEPRHELMHHAAVRQTAEKGHRTVTPAAFTVGAVPATPASEGSPASEPSPQVSTPTSTPTSDDRDGDSSDDAQQPADSADDQGSGDDQQQSDQQRSGQQDGEHRDGEHRDGEQHDGGQQTGGEQHG